MLSSLAIQLQDQHVLDCQVYQSAHQEWYNRALHWILIPCEVASFVALCQGMIQWLWLRVAAQRNPTKILLEWLSVAVNGIGYTMGLVSFLVLTVDYQDNSSPPPYLTSNGKSWILGSVVLLFHVAVVHANHFMLQSIITTTKNIPTTTGTKTSAAFHKLHWFLGVSVVVWTLSWTLQVGVGHALLEGNSPNLANPEDVSLLAVATSVLLAWTCY